MDKSRQRTRWRGVARRWAFSAGLAAALAATLWYIFSPAPLPAASGAMPQEAYVWQRAWTPAVEEAVSRAAPALKGLVYLGAEVSIRNGQPKAMHVSADFKALRAAGSPVGVALRIGPYRGPFAEAGGVAEFLALQAAALLAEARAGGIEPAELQLDFDCAESDLDGYRLWVRAIRRKVSPVPVTITALPCWLKRDAFARLAAEAGGYVLQVHSLERPRNSDAPMDLCDLASARKAVSKAGEIGVPFRVALPTYGYVVGFDSGGRFLGLSAEGPMAAWGPDVRLRELRADPAAMAGLVRGWTASRPACLTGIIWYRLPTDADVLNWRWPTLAAVMAGRSPAAALRAEVRRPEPGLVEIDVCNSGEADVPPPAAVTVRWESGRLLAADAVGGFEPGERTAGSARFTTPKSAPGWRLPPGGQRHMVGWLRFSDEAEVRVDVTP